MRSVAARLGAFVLVGSVLVAGCAEDSETLIRISGKVNYRGTAVPGGTILLQPVSGRAIVAAIDQTGRYQLSAPAGTYQVAIVSSAAIPDNMDPWSRGVKLPPPMVPEKFGRPETSATAITIPDQVSDQQSIDISLL